MAQPCAPTFFFFGRSTCAALFLANQSAPPVKIRIVTDPRKEPPRLTTKINLWDLISGRAFRNNTALIQVGIKSLDISRHSFPRDLSENALQFCTDLVTRCRTINLTFCEKAQNAKG